ncbi:MAG: zinc-dependent metalloprotease [Sphingobacteriaceae bacterium]|nr:zinc-dependent metalloprotease [Sphingobacteriaceae bacterium]
MKKLLFSGLITAFCLWHPLAQAQLLDECGTGDTPPELSEWLQKLDHAQLSAENISNDTIWLAAQIFLVHAPTGAPAITLDSLKRSFQVLNRRFAPAKIQFYQAGMPRYIINQIWSNPPDKQIATLMIDSFNLNRVVNIYFTNLGSQGLCGYAYYPNSGPGGPISRGAAMMSYSCSGPESGTLAHELGHFFSLPHPFQGTSGNPAASTAERVTRDFNETAPRLPANCNTSGDFFCDTKADPYSARWQCLSNPATFDINGDRFFADSSLIMSYAANTCRDIFSEQQMNAMNATLASTSASRGYLLARQRPSTSPITVEAMPLTPAIGATDVQPNFAHFNWTAVPGATFYHVRIKRAAIPTMIKDTVVAGTFLSVYDNKMNINTDFQWSVTPYHENDFVVKPITWHDFRTSTRTATNVFENEIADITVYPNPIQQGNQLNILRQNNEPMDLYMHDLQGKVVFTHLLTAEERAVQLPADLPAGTYLIRLQNNVGKSKTQKILLMP